MHVSSARAQMDNHNSLADARAGAQPSNRGARTTGLRVPVRGARGLREVAWRA